jgi:hypothetical protein
LTRTVQNARAKLSVVHTLEDVETPVEDPTIAARDHISPIEELAAVAVADEVATLRKCAKEMKTPPTRNHNSSAQTMPIIRNLLTA